MKPAPPWVAAIGVALLFIGLVSMHGARRAARGDLDFATQVEASIGGPGRCERVQAPGRVRRWSHVPSVPYRYVHAGVAYRSERVFRAAWYGYPTRQECIAYLDGAARNPSLSAWIDVREPDTAVLETWTAPLAVEWFITVLGGVPFGWFCLSRLWSLRRRWGN